jgi:hypothetical protein
MCDLNFCHFYNPLAFSSSREKLLLNFVNNNTDSCCFKMFKALLFDALFYKKSNPESFFHTLMVSWFTEKLTRSFRKLRLLF